MQKIAIKLVNTFIEFGIIEEDKKDNYLYGAEFIIMKIIGIIIIGIIGICSQKIIETIVFYITFSSLRKYTNGYHSKHPTICIIESIIAYSPYSAGRASVVNGVGDSDDGGWQPAGTYSVANVKWTSSGTNKAFYDYR